MIIAEYQKKNNHQYLHQDYNFWQESNGREVDLLIKTHNGFDIFEIKATHTISSSLFKELDYFEELTPGLSIKKHLIYGGDEDQKRTKYDVISWRNT